MEDLLRQLAPRVLGVLVRRGADFASAEDAVQEALIEAVARWPEGMPSDPQAWLVTVAWRRWLDHVRSESARHRREQADLDEPPPGPTESRDDTLHLLFLCCHPALTPSSAVALTLRAVGGLTTRQIAEAYLVPETTMGQRISRAKRTVADEGLGGTGDLGRVLRVLYLIFNEGYQGEVDLAAEAIRLARELADRADDPEAAGLLALMLLHHARRPSRFGTDGSLVTLAEQDRTRWDTGAIAEGIDILHRALAADRLGEFQAQAAIAALHADAQSADETDWPQIVGWYDELLALTDSPVVALNRAVAVGEADGAQAGLRALAEVPDGIPRRHAAHAFLRERAGEPDRAAELYAEAAARASSTAERDHLTRQAARLRSGQPR
ncbi:RNA polymerase sigma factor [Serinicoccus kebangsaanensis]|uniref:RNA polymerase sigma factor n=1 Tax=Serinicoccus kebangsaanensis TaxID=2602069 RepID=UPI00124BD1BA|nr:sigma-70 family RNA polymerase sigma factor [Serinicoccus kebangsaanensis]